MKITHILAASLIIAGVGMSGAASAQMNNGSYSPRGQQQIDQRSGDTRNGRGEVRGHDDHGRNGGYENRGDMRDHGYNRRSYARDDRRGWGHGRDHCRTEWRHHRQVRICR